MNVFIKITVSEETKEAVENTFRKNGMNLPQQIIDGQVFELDIDTIMKSMNIDLKTAIWFLNLQLKNFKK